MKYLKDIKKTLKGLIPFSNFPYNALRKSFKKEPGELIQLQDIDDLKDLFTEFGDFGFEMEELDSELFSDLISDDSFIYRIVTNVEMGNTSYIRKVLRSRDYDRYVFFALGISKNYSVDQLQDIVNLTDDIYERILYMGYNCDVSFYTKGISEAESFLVFRIGNGFRNTNRLKDVRIKINR